MSKKKVKPTPHGSHEMGDDGAPCKVCWVWTDDDNIANECAGPASEATRADSPWPPPKVARKPRKPKADASPATAPPVVSAAAVLAKHLGLEDDREIIDGHDVVKCAEEMVTLEDAYSPVLPVRGSLWASEVTKLSAESYKLQISGNCNSILAGLSREVSAAELRVMRARWLLTRGEFMRAWNGIDRHTQDNLVAAFFLGQRPWVAPKGSPLDMLTRGGSNGPITIAHDGVGIDGIDFVALMKTLSTPGAAVPATVPLMKDRPPTPPPLAPPPLAVLEGAHGNRRDCDFWKVNDPSVLKVTDLPVGFKLCTEHWDRVKKAQGGEFKRPVPDREFVGNRYVDGRGRR